MDTYIFQAALYCTRCANEIVRELEAADPDTLPRWTRAYLLGEVGRDCIDSSDWPQGPYPASPADYPDHCDRCKVHLENPLTDEGKAYVLEALSDQSGDPEVEAEWLAFYSDMYPDTFGRED